MIEGNIYTYEDIAQIAKQHLSIQGTEVDHYKIQSCKVQKLNIEANIEA